MALFVSVKDDFCGADGPRLATCVWMHGLLSMDVVWEKGTVNSARSAQAHVKRVVGR